MAVKANMTKAGGIQPLIATYASAWRDLTPTERLCLLTLGAAFGAFSVIAIIAGITARNEISEAAEWEIYLLAWVTAPLVATLTAAFLLRISRYLALTLRTVAPLLAAGNIAALAWAFFCVISGYWRMDFPRKAALFLITTAAVNLALLTMASARRARRIPLKLGNLLLPASIFLFLVVISPFSAKTRLYYVNGSWPTVLMVAMGFAAILLLSRRPTGGPLRNGLILAALAAYMVNLTFPYDPHHHNFYLGPIRDVLDGRTMLVQVFSQYGVGVIYALAAIFKVAHLSVSYFSLAAVVMVLNFSVYALAYLLLYRLTRSWLAAVLFIALVVTVTNAPLIYHSIYPSTGGARFGLPYLLLASTLCPPRSLSNRMRLFLELAIVALSSLWSFETFVYTGASYAAMTLFRAACLGATPRARLKALGKCWGTTAVVVLATHLCFAGFTFVKSGQWPDWMLYKQFILTYSPGVGFGTLPVAPLAGWELVSLVYLCSLIACLAKAFEEIADSRISDFTVVSGMTAFGIAQFTYYLGRSHPDNLLRVAVPAIFLGLYWVWYLLAHKAIHWPLKLAVCFGVSAVSALSLTNAQPQMREKYQGSSLAYLVNLAVSHTAGTNYLNCLFHRCRNSALPAEVTSYIDELSPPGSAIGLFDGRNSDINAVLLDTGRHHIYPMAEIEQDVLVDDNVRRILSTNIHPSREAGDLLVVANHLLVDGAVPVQIDESGSFTARMLSGLCMKFSCQFLRRGKDYSALRLGQESTAHGGSNLSFTSKSN